jgi:hypothetical protein
MTCVKLCLLSLCAAGAFADSIPGAIDTFDPTTLAATNQGFFTNAIPSSIAFNGGSIFAVLTGGQLIQYGTNGSIQVTEGFQPFGSVNAQDGNVLLGSFSGIAADGNNWIAQIDDIFSNGLVYNFLGATTALPSAVAMASGNTYALVGDRIEEFDSNQNLVASFGIPSLITFGSLSEGNGNVYVSMCEFGSPCRINILLDVENTSFTVLELADTSSLATSILFANNSIYATFADGTISRYDTSGNLEASVADPGAVFTGLAYGDGELFASTEAPEPASGGLAALGALGLFLYKRRGK